MRAAAAVVGCLVVGLTWAGCSSTDNQPKGAGGSAGSNGGSRDGGPRDPNLNCVKPGTPNNEKGVGAYCESSADCVTDVGGFFICSGDFESTPRYTWFCTTFCTVDADCGTNAFCGHSDLGGGCVPNGCGPGPEGGVADGPTEGGDASVDAAPDGRSDAPADATPEAAMDSAPEASPDVAADVAPDIVPDVTADVAADVPGDSPAETASDGAAD